MNWTDRVIEPPPLNLVLISVWSWTDLLHLSQHSCPKQAALLVLTKQKCYCPQSCHFYKGEWNEGFVNQIFTVGQRQRNQFKEVFSVVETLAGAFELRRFWLEDISVVTRLKLILTQESGISRVEVSDSGSVTLIYFDYISSNKWYIRCSM